MLNVSLITDLNLVGWVEREATKKCITRAPQSSVENPNIPNDK